MQIDQKALDELERLKATLARIASPMKLSPSDIRPTDMAELAQAVARELRDKGLRARAETYHVFPHYVDIGSHVYYMGRTDFDNLTPSEIASLIQSEEAKRAAEWAGDK